MTMREATVVALVESHTMLSVKDLHEADGDGMTFDEWMEELVRVWGPAADAAITACLTALAAEAEERGLYVYDPDSTITTNPVQRLPDYILSFLPSQPEVKDE